MYLVNHYLDYSLFGILLPDEADASTTNSVASIVAQSTICSGLYGRNPNFILVSSNFSVETLSEPAGNFCVV